MIEFINGLVGQFNAYAKLNPVIAGAFSLWGLGIVTFFFRNVPSRVWNFIVIQSTTSVYFDNTATCYNAENYNGFMRWYLEQKWSKYSRSFSLLPKYFDEYKDEKDGPFRYMQLAAGKGNHIFFFSGRLFFINQWIMEKQGTHQPISCVSIVMLGRDRKIINKLLECFIYKGNTSNDDIYRPAHDGWTKVAKIVPRQLSSVVINKDIKNKVVADIEEFLVTRQWYVDRGDAYKKTIIFHGTPGTGKTSLIRGLATHFKRNLCLINLNEMTDGSFLSALASLPPHSIAVIEDFEDIKAVKARKANKRVVRDIPREWSAPNVGATGMVSGGLSDYDEPQQESFMSSLNMLTISGMLNTLDGLILLDDAIIILSTNHLHKVDPAMIRTGRVDHIYELKALGHVEVLEYIELMFPGAHVPSRLRFNPIVGSDLRAIYMEHKNDARMFINSIPCTILLHSNDNLTKENHEQTANA
jgi:chaperone BCS1